MLCKYCKKEIADDSVFCQYCGAPLNGQSTPKKYINSITDVSTESLTNAMEDDYGVAYSEDGKRLLKCKNKELIEYTVKEGTEVICDEAFRDCKKLTSLVLPEGLTEIGYDAFWGCKSLRTIKIPDSVTKISKGAFDECESLKTMELKGRTLRRVVHRLNGDGETSLSTIITEKDYNNGVKDEYGVVYSSDGKRLLRGCQLAKSRYTVKKGTRVICDKAFYECKVLEAIKLPDWLYSIGEGAFEDCKNLRTISLHSGVPTIGNWAFDGCDRLEKIYIRDDFAQEKGAIIKKFKEWLPKELHKKIEIVR